MVSNPDAQYHNNVNQSQSSQSVYTKTSDPTVTSIYDIFINMKISFICTIKDSNVESIL